jgi:glutathione S-transferase
MCLYAQHAWITLQELGVDYEMVTVDYKTSRKTFLSLSIRWQTWFIDGAHAKVPLLQVLDKNNVFLCKSLIVSQYIADKHHVLLPSSHEDVAIMHSLQNSVAFPSYFPSLRAKKEKLEAAIQMFWQESGVTDTFLNRHGTEEGHFYLAMHLAWQKEATQLSLYNVLVQFCLPSQAQWSSRSLGNKERGQDIQAMRCPNEVVIGSWKCQKPAIQTQPFSSSYDILRSKKKQKLINT